MRANFLVLLLFIYLFILQIYSYCIAALGNPLAPGPAVGMYHIINLYEKIAIFIFFLF